MSNLTTSQATGVCIPVHALVDGELLRQLEHASSVTSTATDEDGGFFGLLATMQAAEAVTAGSVIVVPLAPPVDDEALYFTYVARAKAMIVTVLETPQYRQERI